MNRIRNFGIGAAVLVLFAVIFIVLSLLTKKPKPAYDFSAATASGEVISLSDSYKPSGAVLIFFDPEVEGSVKLLTKLSENIKSAEIVAVSVSKLTQAEQLGMLSEDILALPKLCFEGSEAVSTYNIGNAPITYFIDTEGYVIDAFVGDIKATTIQKREKKLGQL